MFPGADFYGIRKILLKYSGLPTFLPLPVAVQHGWQRFAHTFEASARPPEIWVWSSRLAKDLERFYPSRQIKITGSFFFYMMDTMKDELAICAPHGSICIPPHSSHLGKTEYSLERYVKHLTQMDDGLKPITVMLYYLDMNEHTVGVYERAGFSVVSNGSLYDEGFLRNFIGYVHGKKYCIYSELGSGVLYASELGLVPVRIDVQSNVINQGNPHITNEMISSTTQFDDDFEKKMRMDESVINEEMGRQFVLSPKEMRSLIIKNYFTWQFMRVATIRAGGIILRSLGLRRRHR